MRIIIYRLKVMEIRTRGKVVYPPIIPLIPPKINRCTG